MSYHVIHLHCSFAIMAFIYFADHIPSTVYRLYHVPVIAEILCFASGTRSSCSCSSKHSCRVSVIFHGQVFLIFLFSYHFLLFYCLSFSSYPPFSFFTSSLCLFHLFFILFPISFFSFSSTFLFFLSCYE